MVQRMHGANGNTGAPTLTNCSPGSDPPVGTPAPARRNPDAAWPSSRAVQGLPASPPPTRPAPRLWPLEHSRRHPTLGQRIGLKPTPQAPAPQRQHTTQNGRHALDERQRAVELKNSSIRCATTTNCGIIQDPGRRHKPLRRYPHRQASASAASAATSASATPCLGVHAISAGATHDQPPKRAVSAAHPAAARASAGTASTWNSRAPMRNNGHAGVNRSATAPAMLPRCCGAVRSQYFGPAIVESLPKYSGMSPPSRWRAWGGRQRLTAR